MMMETYIDGARYFNANMRSGGVVAYSGDDVWFHADNGDSVTLTPKDILIPEKDFTLLLGIFISAAQQSQQLAIEQGCDNNTTMTQQHPDSVATMLRQDADKKTTRDTAAARQAKRPPLSRKKYLKLHGKVVEILKDGKLIKRLSNGVYKSYKDLPQNVPQYIVDYLVKCNIKRTDGKDFTQETLSPIVSAMKINSRPSKFRMVYLICLSVLIAVAVTKVWGWFSGDVSHETMQTNVSQQIKTKSNFDFNDVDLICKQNKIKLTEYRVKLILAKQYTDKADLEEEIKRQYAEMLNAMKK